LDIAEDDADIYSDDENPLPLPPPFISFFGRSAPFL
jgi:hypothetical protein